MIIIESQPVLSVITKHVLKTQEPVAVINNSQTKVYNLGNYNFAILYKEQTGLTHGELVEVLREWLEKSERIFTITSQSISTYINNNLHIKPTSLIRNLTTDNSLSFGYEKLETPNLITGFSAAVFTYSIYNSWKCSLFVFYIDSLPLDSINSSPLVDLLQKIDLPINKIQTKLLEPSNNLYM